uniref:Uncharacterized protein n=1 Tax=Arundo donax TaxID=35708 RepID=A0A0A8ZWV7_ARUDO
MYWACPPEWALMGLIAVWCQSALAFFCLLKP